MNPSPLLALLGYLQIASELTLNLQKVHILMRWVIITRIIWIFTFCPLVYEFSTLGLTFLWRDTENYHQIIE